jgi:hypothetical protein
MKTTMKVSCLLTLLVLSNCIVIRRSMDLAINSSRSLQTLTSGPKPPEDIPVPGNQIPNGNFEIESVDWINLNGSAIIYGPSRNPNWPAVTNRLVYFDGDYGCYNMYRYIMGLKKAVYYLSFDWASNKAVSS